MWASLLINLAVLAVTSLFAPEQEKPEAATIEDFDVPVSKEGEELGISLGSVWIKSPQIVWYGHLRKKEVKQSGKK